MVNYLALLSWHPADEREKFTLDELVRRVRPWRGCRKSPAIFDIEKLNWLNGLYIRELARPSSHELVAPYLGAAGIEFAPGAARGGGRGHPGQSGGAGRCARSTRGSSSKRSIPTTCGLCRGCCWHRAARCSSAWRREALRRHGGRVPAGGRGPGLLRRPGGSRPRQQGIKGKAIYHPLRVALSGRDEGPELFYLVAGLGKSRILCPPRRRHWRYVDRGRLTGDDACACMTR